MHARLHALFVELLAFERHREDYFGDRRFPTLQNELMKSPKTRDEIQGPGGLQKLRFADARRSKGTRGGLSEKSVSHSGFPACSKRWIRWRRQCGAA